jgi:hypothetical protein
MLSRRAGLLATGVLGATILASSATSCVLIADIDYDLIQDPKPADAGTDSQPPSCLESSACDDGSECTEDTCQAGECVFTPLAAGTSCGTSVACSITYACSTTGTCTSTPVVLDDSNACTNDVCEPSTGEVSHVPIGGGCVSWVPLPEENAPSARFNHVAVWTGSKLIIWGGETVGPDPVLGDGATYDPETRVWAPMSKQGAPTPRLGHRAVWTGSRMIVWGGYAANGLATAGGLYDPETDAWTPMATTGEPKPRIHHGAVWDGSEMLVWGGSAEGIAMNTGAVYSPGTNTWKPMPQAGTLSPRALHSATWVGTRMVVWGGTDFFDWLADGRIYDPSTNSWAGATATQNAPSFRESHTVVWTGSKMIVWGGWNGGPFLDTGAVFTPNGSMPGAWAAVSTTGAPSPRRDHIAVWTGSSMLVWGGCGSDLCSTLLADGGTFVPSDNGGSWTPIPAVPALSARRGHTAVYTGSRIIVWGGRDAAGPVGTGAEAQL